MLLCLVLVAIGVVAYRWWNRIPDLNSPNFVGNYVCLDTEFGFHTFSNSTLYFSNGRGRADYDAFSYGRRYSVHVMRLDDGFVYKWRDDIDFGMKEPKAEAARRGSIFTESLISETFHCKRVWSLAQRLFRLPDIPFYPFNEQPYEAYE